MKTELNDFFYKNKNAGEVELFREMEKILSKKYHSIFIEETHQNYVEFQPSIIGSNIQRKEISDLCIIAYSPTKREARMTFLQAKYNKNDKIIKPPFRFKGDYLQYDLLSNRPEIEGTGELINIPKNILSGALLESIGTFGIFYFDTNKQIDFAYSRAADLKFRGMILAEKINKNNSFSRTIYFPKVPYGHLLFRYTHPYLELRCTLNADYFEFSLINLHIGTPIENDKKVLNYIGRLLLAKLKNEDKIKENFKSFLKVMEIDTNGIDPQTENNILAFPSNNILLINVDAKE